MNPSLQYKISIAEIVNNFVRNKSLIFQMTKREVVGRYRGSILGIVWSLFNSFILLTVFMLVISMIYKAKWGVGSDSKKEFALVVFVGMIVNGVMATGA